MQKYVWEVKTLIDITKTPGEYTANKGNNQ